ncbi:hypothetical protein D5F01_LYC06689 [Larimichthys crocea]|uniref:Uncharacterized protein n=1 Tax=Larimichthys crocea TaxID=215358 RepID=A0A6G0IR97_LARCR|nr:hypothetical protein D5F01_LYC06689 [Larimichthys crocea]
MASLSPEDGHDKCPSCLGIAHLKQALTESACINCICMLLAERTARPKRHGHTQDDASVANKKRRGVEPLALKVDTLASEFAQIKALLLSLQPSGPSDACTAASELPLEKPPRSYAESDSLASLPRMAGQQDEDTLSIAASENLFTDYEAGGQEELEGGSPLPTVEGSHESGADSLRDAEVNKVKQQFADLGQAPLPRPRHTSAPRSTANAQGESRAGHTSFQQGRFHRAPLPFGLLKTGHLDTDHLQTDTLSCPKVGGVGPDCLDPGASRFFPQYLGQWEALTSDPWVLLTLSKGYSVQFRL